MGQNEFLFWDGEVHDFDLELEFRLSGGPAANSAIQFRSQRRANGHAAGYQADLDDGTTWLGRMYDEEGRGLLVERGTGVSIAPSTVPPSEYSKPGLKIAPLLVFAYGMFVSVRRRLSKYSAPAKPVVEPRIATDTRPEYGPPVAGGRLVTEKVVHTSAGVLVVKCAVSLTEIRFVPE